MKPKILLLLGDTKIGGIKSSVDSLVSSRLSEQFEFINLTLDAAKPAIKSLKADVIIVKYSCTWRRLPLLWSLRRLNPSTKIIIQEHHYSPGFEQSQVPSPSRFRLMLKLSYGLVDRVIAVSQAQGEWMHKNRLISPKKLTVIQQCRQLEKFLNVPLKPVQRPLTLAAYGRFYPQKGFDDLLKAMNLLPSELVNLHLGGEGSQEEELKQLAEGLNNTKLFGTVTDVPAFLEQCDAVVIPSRWEPWGIVCIEAKAAGKPVIAADIDGLTEQVKDCDCGILVPPHDFQQLADGIASFCNQSERTLETWGRAGRESVKNAWEKYLDNWQALLWNVIKA